MTFSLLQTISETTVVCFIWFAAIIGNVSLFVIVYKNRNLHSTNNLFILNLAAAEILVSVLSMPVTVVTIIKEQWVFGDAACVALGFFTILSFIASVMFLGMIAINRYFYIVKWNTYTTTFSKKKAMVYGAAVWVVSISLASPPLFGWAEYRFIPRKSYCFVYWPSNVYFMYFMITVCFFGPLSVIAFSYYNILAFTRDVKKKVANARNNLTPQPEQQKPTASNQVQNNIKLDSTETKRPQMSKQITNNPDIIEKDWNEAETPNFKSKFRDERVTPEEVRITNTLILVVALFIICWAPFAITMFFDVYYPRPLPRAVNILSLLLGYLNSMCNPTLYGVRNPAFRQGFVNLYSRFIPGRFRNTNAIQPESISRKRRDVPSQNMEKRNDFVIEQIEFLNM